MAETANSIAFVLFLGSSMTMVLGLGRARRSRLADESSTGNPFSFQLLFAGDVADTDRAPLLPQATGAFGAFGALVALLSFGACGCDSRSAVPTPRTEPDPAPVASLATLLGVDAGELEARLDPPAPPGDLEAEIDRFTTLDACVEARAQLDPLLGDALEAVGYDTFLRDACRVIDAAKANDANRCAAIDASALETRCRATVAEVAAAPDTCPWETSSRPDRGRDAKCLAVASRNPLLCGAVADPLERATCEAILGNDTRPCASLRARTEKARCVRDAARWRGVLAARAPGAAETTAAEARASVGNGASSAPAGTLHIERQTGTDTAGGPIDVDLAPDLARGVTLMTQRDGARLTIGPLTETGLDFIAPSPHVRASLALELFVPAGLRGAEPVVRIERAELVVPGRPPLATPGAQSTLAAKLDKLALVRGSVVALVVDGDISASGSSWHVHASGRTFVRDVVKGSDDSRDSLKVGADAGMR
jgi:hypothetical protein